MVYWGADQSAYHRYCMYDNKVQCLSMVQLRCIIMVKFTNCILLHLKETSAEKREREENRQKDAEWIREPCRQAHCTPDYVKGRYIKGKSHWAHLHTDIVQKLDQLQKKVTIQSMNKPGDCLLRQYRSHLDVQDFMLTISPLMWTPSIARSTEPAVHYNLSSFH